MYRLRGVIFCSVSHSTSLLHGRSSCNLPSTRGNQSLRWPSTICFPALPLCLPLLWSGFPECTKYLPSSGLSCLLFLCLKPLLCHVYMACSLACFRIENVDTPTSDFSWAAVEKGYMTTWHVNLLGNVCLFLVECQHCVGRDLACSVPMVSTVTKTRPDT